MSATLTLCFCSSHSDSAKKDVPAKVVKATPVVAEVVKTPKVSGVPRWLWNTTTSPTSCWFVVSACGGGLWAWGLDWPGLLAELRPQP